MWRAASLLRPSYRRVAALFEKVTQFASIGHRLALASHDMDPLTAMAASGMRSRMESLDMLANNIANASTGGYKADREFYSLYAEAENPSTMPVVQKPYTDLSQGMLQNTGNQLDLAISGQGFFAVQGPSGPLYTRNGSFRTDSSGKLTSAEGYPVQGKGGAITIPGKLPIEISGDGTVTQDSKVIGQLQIADFTSGAGLTKQGSNYFRAADPGGMVKAPAGSSVEQGKLEASNSGTAESAVRLVSIMRQFEMLQKAATMGADMDKQAIEQVAKV
jgi:flagellar basal-body rod protein FlgF